MSDFPDGSASDFTVGISGHRWNKIPADAASRIAGQLSSVFSEIEAAVRDECRRHGRPVPIFRLISGLAEGADQMAVSSRPAGWLLRAILPFPRARYESDFAPANATGGIDRRPDFRSALAQASSIVELPDPGDPVVGYEQAGEAMLQESDLLVVVWDGLTGSGRGGTETVIARAMALELPVIWIRSDRDQIPTRLPALRSGSVANANHEAADFIRRAVVEVMRGERAHR